MAAKLCTARVNSPVPVRDVRKFVKRVSSILKRKESKLGITISEVFVGGSLGQGTILPEHCDVDLVVYSPNLHPRHAKMSEQHYSILLRKVNKCLSQSIEDMHNVQKLYHGWRFNSSDIQVDLQFSPQWRKKHLEDFYDYLQGMHHKRRPLFSCGASKYQTMLIKSQPDRVKIIIKRFKAWRDRAFIENKNGYPKSYLVSMLVLISYHRAPVNLRQGASLQALAKWMNRDLKNLVRSIVEDQDLDLRVPGENPVIKKRYSWCLPDKPRIIDPANPFQNLYKRGLLLIQPQQKDSFKRRWDIFLRKIHTLDLTQQL